MNRPDLIVAVLPHDPIMIWLRRVELVPDEGSRCSGAMVSSASGKKAASSSGRSVAVPQVKKADMRNAILEAAFGLFALKGYSATTMAEIARTANTTVANLYNYYPSKLVLLYEIYNPWLSRQLEELKKSVQKFRSPRTRLRRILLGIWGDIPAADHCFANTLMEALAEAMEQTGKPSDMLARSEAFLTDLLRDCLPDSRRGLVRNSLLAHTVWMAFDGFAINRRIGDVRDMEAVADMVVDLLLGEGATLTAADCPVPQSAASENERTPRPPVRRSASR